MKRSDLVGVLESRGCVLADAADISVAGVDGCPAGWFVVARTQSDARWICTWRPSFAEIVDLVGDTAMVAVDIPIGLLDHAQPGGRQCDRAARKVLGPGRRSSVFSAPSRDVLGAATHAEANACSKAGSFWDIGVSLQTFYITGKVREVDDALRSGRASQDRVREVHPELAFWEMGGRGLVPANKKTTAGVQERQRLLEGTGWFTGLDFGEVLACFPRRDVGRDDILDAAAACWSAGRLVRCQEKRVVDRPPKDSHGLVMQISW